MALLLMSLHKAGASRREATAFLGALHGAFVAGEHRVAHFFRIVDCDGATKLGAFARLGMLLRMRSR